MDAADNDDNEAGGAAGFGGSGGGEDDLPPLPPPTHHPHFPPADTQAATQPSSLASEAYLAVRDFLSASVAEARGDRGSAAAHAAAAASRVQTAVDAEDLLPRGDFGPVCDLLATAFAWKAQALGDALESGTPTETGAGAGSLSPSLLSAALPLPRPFAAASARRHQHRRQHHHRHGSARPSRFPGDEEDLLLDLPVYLPEEQLQHQQQQPVAATTTTTDNNNTNTNNEDAALEAELVRRCMRRPAGLPADPRALSRVQGLRDVKRELEDAMLLPLRLPVRLRRALRGVRRPPRTFLLHGPPGTGKTLLAEAAAAAAGATLLCASPSAVLSKWSGESERAVRLLFSAAERLAPCVVFLDEVDALGASRGGFAIGNAGGGGDGGGGAAGNQDALARRVLTELLVQMSRLDGDAERGGGDEEGDGSGSGKRGPVWVFAATNRLCDVDPALLRRFERRVAVPLPDAEGRAALVKAALRELDEQEEQGGGTAGGHALSEADVARVAAAMQGLSGADVRAVARRAALAPVRELGEEVRRRWASSGEEEGGAGGGRKRRRSEEEEEEEDDDDDDDGSLRLRPVCAGDWEAALAALFGGGAASAEERGGEGGGAVDAASG